MIRWRRVENMTIRTGGAWLLAGMACLAGPAAAQAPGRGGAPFADWPTFVHDPQRTGWAFEETRIAPGTVSQMTLLWKTKLDSEPYSLWNLVTPIVMSGISAAKGMRPGVYTISAAAKFAMAACSSSRHFPKPRICFS